MINVKNLSKHYGQIAAVDDINIEVNAGEIFGFIGPNGAGKTTSIKLISGILSPTNGSINICGIDMIKDPVMAKKQIGLIPDRPFLYEKLTGIEFLRFISDFYDISDDDFDQRSDEILQMFNLEDRANELIQSYSHGMKQRLIMCSALIHDPPLIIVDEPMVGLDPKAIILVKKLFKYLSSIGKTIFLSTHTLTLAEDICDRIGIINQGKLIAQGTMKELKEKVRSGEANLEELFFKLTD